MAGSRALLVISKWFDAATVHRTFEPLIADWQREWLEAPKSRRALVWIRGLLGLAIAIAFSSPAIFRTRVPASVSNRVVSRITVVVGVGTLLLMIPPIMNPFPWQPSGIDLLMLVPGAMTFAFPFAMIAAVDAIRTHRGVSPQLERAAVLKLAAFAVVFMLAFDGWVVPAANQAWRVAMTPPGTGAPLRGMRELTTWELVSNSDRATVYAPGTALASKSISIRRELSERTALLGLPLVLAWRRWGALSRRTRVWYAPLPVSIATIGTIAVFVVCSSFGATIERQRPLPFSVAFWLPALTLIIAGTLGRLARRRDVTW